MLPDRADVLPADVCGPGQGRGRDVDDVRVPAAAAGAGVGAGHVLAGTGAVVTQRQAARQHPGTRVIAVVGAAAHQARDVVRGAVLGPLVADRGDHVVQAVEDVPVPG